MGNVLLILALMALGVLLRRLRVLPDNAGQTLMAFIIWVSLPAVVLRQVPQIEFGGEVWLPALMPWVMAAVSVGLVLAASRAFRWERGVTGALLLLVPLGNTSFLGFPMVDAFFGEDAIAYAVLYDQLGSFPLLAIYGAWVVAAYSDGPKVNAGQILRRILTFPPFIALLVAVACRLSGVDWLDRIDALLEPVAGSLVPVVMVGVGFQLSIRLPARYYAPFAFGLAAKLVVAPLIALALILAIGADSVAARVSVFEAGMPPMISAGALAIGADLAPRTTAAMVGIGIPLSFATLAALHSLL